MATEEVWSEGVVASQWFGNECKLLVQQAGSIRVISPEGDETTDTLFMKIPHRNVLGFGYAAGDCWIAEKCGEKVVYQLGADSSKQVVLEDLLGKQVLHALASPDAKSIACVISGSAVGIWSADGGGRRGILRIQVEDDKDNIFGAPEIEHISWSADSRFLALQFGPAMDELLVVDAHRCRVVRAIA